VTLPTGTVTFFFTDIEGSTGLLQALGQESYGRLQDEHSSIMRAAIEQGSGVEIRTEGDAFFAVFGSPAGAALAAAEAQKGLAAYAWPDGSEIRVRIGMHTGEGSLGGDDYLGIDVNRAARIAAVGHGGQVVVSAATAGLIEQTLPDGVVLRDLGLHRLKDFPDPLRLHDLVIPGLPSDFAQLRTLDARPTNLPTERTSFVGRAEEVARLEEMLGAGRLVTLVGPGGAGKTRLAIHVASQMLDRFTEGAFLVDLSAVTDASVVLPEIAAALKVRRDPGQDTAEALQAHLRDRRLLLVLDNMEQVVEAAAVVGDLLDGSPGLAVLVTSRVPLQITGEQRFAVQPMPVPTDDAVDAGSFDAVRLFAERAAAVHPGFELDERTTPAVARIVTALDGLPLALELAASRMALLSPDALADRLTQRLPMLTGGPRDAPERQRTLAAAIGWSYDLLDDDARVLFARLSMFAGGSTLDAAERVAGEGLDVLDLMGTLTDASLVRRSDPVTGDVRYSMLETIREFAGERLDAAGEREAIGHRLAAWARSLAIEAEPHLVGAEQVDWFALLEREHDNVRAALDVAERHGDDRTAVEAGLRTSAAIWRFWQERGHLAEGEARLSRLLDLPEAQHPDEARARALGGYGGLLYWRSAFEEMRHAYEEAATIARSLDDSELLASAMFDLSFVAGLADGDFEAGERILQEALEVLGDGDALLRSRILGGVGFSRMLRGDAAGAVGPFEQAIEIQRDIGDRLGISQNLVGLAGMRLMLGDADAARALVREATEVATALVREGPKAVTSSTNASLLSTVLLPNAIVASFEGRHEDAARLLGGWERLETEFLVRFPDVAIAQFGDPALAAREALGDETYERAFAYGFELDNEGLTALVRAGGEVT
jgi:predicted ATPase/class 3 adenylate cyclase